MALRHRIALLAATALVVAAPAALAEPLVAVTTTGAFFFVDSASPGVIRSTGTVRGTNPGEAIVGIDLRPATRSLFVVTSASRVFELDTNTGNLGLRGSFATPVTGTYGIDFNPTVDRIRVVHDGEQNYRLVPDSGALAATDTALAPAGNVVAAAYTNNFVGGGVTTLFVIDSASNQLLRQGGPDGNPSPNGGALTVIGPLGVDPTGDVAFEITPAGAAFAAMSVGGNNVRKGNGAATNLYAINLATGAAALIGQLGTGAAVAGIGGGPAVGSAIPTLSGGMLVLLGAGLLLLGALLIRRRLA